MYKKTNEYIAEQHKMQLRIIEVVQIYKNEGHYLKILLQSNLGYI